MSRLDLEYDIKRDIHNNPIVREIDKSRQRELWRSVAIGVCLVGVLLFSAWQHFELLRHGYELEQMEQERARELELNRHLRLEIETLRSPRRIEQIAREQLNLVAPTPAQAQVIERIASSAPPGRSVVASRDASVSGQGFADEFSGPRHQAGRARRGSIPLAFDQGVTLKSGLASPENVPESLTRDTSTPGVPRP